MNELNRIAIAIERIASIASGQEVLKRVVKPRGNTAYIPMPRAYIGKKAKVTINDTKWIEKRNKKLYNKKIWRFCSFSQGDRMKKPPLKIINGESYINVDLLIEWIKKHYGFSEHGIGSHGLIALVQDLEILKKNIPNKNNKRLIREGLIAELLD